MSNLKFALFACVFMFLLSFQPPPQQPKTITITVTLSDADLIIKGLGKLSYEESAGLIQNVIAQAQKQLADTTINKPKK